MIEEVSNIADAYAQGLLLAAKNDRTIEEVLAASTMLLELLDIEPKFAVLIAAPHIMAANKERVVAAALEKKLPLLLYRLVVLLIRRHRGMHLRNILVRFRDLATEEVGRIPTVVQSAIPLSDALQRRIERTLERLTSRDLDIQWHVNPDLLGGIRVSFEGVVMDGTLRRGIKALRALFTEQEQ